MYVVFGRPKGDRGSYRQWEEGDVPLTVVFEVLCPGKPVSEMLDKESFYEQYGVEEYYVYDPDSLRLFVYLRQGDLLRRIRPVTGFVSPRLRIRLDMAGRELIIFRPDGQPFLTFEELEAARLAELSRKARRQQASPEELAELERLEQPNPPSP